MGGDDDDDTRKWVDRKSAGRILRYLVMVTLTFTVRIRGEVWLLRLIRFEWDCCILSF